ncbi:MFS transporter [Pseudonocardia sp. KRD291]|uniref:MFS transporter n=1 Tax=Pseudonocardia sp. KRD291 TaxID=2792007 RepID=UPI001C4A179D|nr:MFS transporter [Pseudonocardia sp. KRD291]MBW0106165.1 MFS transporter [Pseudonocardia sp. KRD291]
MNTDDTEGQSTSGAWGELLGRRHLGAMLVLAGGVALYATNVFLTTSLLPSATAEIGGEELYAWATTIFLLGSVITSVLVSRLLRATSGRTAYLVAIAAFVLGTIVCALAPSMPVLLAGRAVQGAGGGLLAGLGYALIRSTLPSTLWARGTALISAMWGVGTFLGPALGGAFAELGAWRGAFVALAVVALVVGVLVPWALPNAREDVEDEPFPLISLILVTAAALCVSVASVFATPLISIAGVLVGVLLLVLFLAHERRTSAGVLPSAAFRTGSPVRWIYLTIAVLAVGSTAETFVPLFGQRLAGLAPLAAGFLGAAIAAGWTLGEIPSAGASRPGVTRRIVIAGPLVLAGGLGLAAVTQQEQAGGVTIALWVAAMVVAGSGIGMAWPHLAAGAMTEADGGSDGDKASAAINTVQLVANSFGASLTGVLVNLGEPDTVLSARYLFGGFAVLAVAGTAAAILSQRRTHTGPATKSYSTAAHSEP